MGKSQPMRIDSARCQGMKHERIVSIDRIGERNFHRPTLPSSCSRLLARLLGLVRKLVIRVRRRGARLARREEAERSEGVGWEAGAEEEYSTYCDDEQRCQAGWIVVQIVADIF